MTELTEIRPDRDLAAQKRRIFGRALRKALATHGDEFAGFALVTWDNRGEASSAFYADTGPVGMCLVPTYAHDALNRHVAVVITQNAEASRITGGA